MNTTIYITLAIIVLTAFWNAYVIKWYLTKDQKYSKIWHGIGFVIRGLLVALIYLLTDNWYVIGGAAFLCWLPYNMIINVVNGWGLFYIGKTSWIDKLIRKIVHLFGIFESS